MSHRMGTKGQVVIPKEMRDRGGFGPGTPVAFEERKEGILMRAAKRKRPLGGRYAGIGGDMAAKLLEDRRREPR